MEGLVKGDIIVIEFPFSDLERGKRRPALIIKVPKGDDVIVCQITGESYDISVEIPLDNNDFQEGNLKRKSFVRIDKLASVEKSLIKYKAGKLKEEKFNLVLDKICSYLKE